MKRHDCVSFALLALIGNTIDVELEKKNFGHAGETLASLWNEKEYDGFGIRSEYIPPPADGKVQDSNADDEVQDSNAALDHEWLSRHVKCVSCLYRLFPCRPLSKEVWLVVKQADFVLATSSKRCFLKQLLCRKCHASADNTRLVILPFVRQPTTDRL